MKFFTPTNEAINAQYKGEFFKNHPERKLCALVKKQNKMFVGWMHEWGHSYKEKGLSPARNSKLVTMGLYSSSLASPEVISREDWISKIQQIQEDCGGLEPEELFNPAHLTDVFKDQSRRWRAIAEAHVQNVWTTTNVFLLDTVRYAVGNGNAHTASAIIRHIINPAMETRRELVFAKLDEILRPWKSFW